MPKYAFSKTIDRIESISKEDGGLSISYISASGDVIFSESTESRGTKRDTLFAFGDKVKELGLKEKNIPMLIYEMQNDKLCLFAIEWTRENGEFVSI